MRAFLGLVIFGVLLFGLTPHAAKAACEGSVNSCSEEELKKALDLSSSNDRQVGNGTIKDIPGAALFDLGLRCLRCAVFGDGRNTTSSSTQTEPPARSSSTSTQADQAAAPGKTDFPKLINPAYSESPFTQDELDLDRHIHDTGISVSNNSRIHQEFDRKIARDQEAAIQRANYERDMALARAAVARRNAARPPAESAPSNGNNSAGADFMNGFINGFSGAYVPAQQYNPAQRSAPGPARINPTVTAPRAAPSGPCRGASSNNMRNCLN